MSISASVLAFAADTTTPTDAPAPDTTTPADAPAPDTTPADAPAPDTTLADTTLADTTTPADAPAPDTTPADAPAFAADTTTPADAPAPDTTPADAPAPDTTPADAPAPDTTPTDTTPTDTTPTDTTPADATTPADTTANDTQDHEDSGPPQSVSQLIDSVRRNQVAFTNLMVTVDPSSTPRTLDRAPTPEERRYLHDVQILYIRGQWSNSLPPWVHTLFPNLVGIVVDLKLHHLPVEIIDLAERSPRFHTMTINATHMTSLPHAFERILVKLKHLHLNRNSFRQVPPILRNAHQLEDLDFSFNDMEVFPQWFPNLCRVRELNVSNNPRLDPQTLQVLQLMPRLTLLQLERANVATRDLEMLMPGLDNLHTLVIDNNRLDKDPEFFLRRFPKLTVIRVDNDTDDQPVKRVRQGDV
jgi:hypothetical protein